MSNIYLVYGSAEPRIDEKVKAITAKYIDSEDEFSCSKYELPETPYQAIFEDAMTIPFLTDQKVIIIKHAYVFTGERVKTQYEHDNKELLDFIEHFDGPNIIIFEVNHEKLDERKKIVKQIKKLHEVIQIEPLDENGTKQLIKKKLNEQFKDIKEDALNEMIQLTGIEYGTVMQELEKLQLYMGDTPVITKEDVSNVVSRSLEQNVFLLTDYITEGKKNKAVVLLKDLINMKEEPIKLLSLISSQYRLFYQCKILSQKGYSEAQIAKTVKVHPYRVKLALRKARNMDLKRMLKIMNECAETDYALKSSYMDKVLILELFILKI